MVSEGGMFLSRKIQERPKMQQTVGGTVDRGYELATRLLEMLRVIIQVRLRLS